jgi:hypothetical protein
MAKRKIFEELKLALGDALAYERGEKVNLRTTKAPKKKPITTVQHTRSH